MLVLYILTLIFGCVLLFLNIKHLSLHKIEASTVSKEYTLTQDATVNKLVVTNDTVFEKLSSDTNDIHSSSLTVDRIQIDDSWTFRGSEMVSDTIMQFKLRLNNMQAELMQPTQYITTNRVVDFSTSNSFRIFLANLLQADNLQITGTHPEWFCLFKTFWGRFQTFDEFDTMQPISVVAITKLSSYRAMYAMQLSMNVLVPSSIAPVVSLTVYLTDDTLSLSDPRSNISIHHSLADAHASTVEFYSCTITTPTFFVVLPDNQSWNLQRFVVIDLQSSNLTMNQPLHLTNFSCSIQQVL